jgi:hypothetical protein
VKLDKRKPYHFEPKDGKRKVSLVHYSLRDPDTHVLHMPHPRYMNFAEAVDEIFTAAKRLLTEQRILREFGLPSKVVDGVKQAA